MEQFFGAIWTYVEATLAENAASLVSIWFLLTLVAKLAPNVRNHPWYARVETVLPFALGVAAAFIPGWIDGLEEAVVGEKIKHGITLGGLAMGGFKIWRQTILGKDERIEAAKAAATVVTDAGKPGA